MVNYLCEHQLRLIISIGMGEYLALGGRMTLMNALIRNKSWCRHEGKHRKTNISGGCFTAPPDKSRHEIPETASVWNLVFFIPYIHIYGYVMDIVSTRHWHYNK